MSQDFAGQYLRGRSFKGQDLTGANFSRADIRSADFTGANLTGANFSHAKAGLTDVRKAIALTGLFALSSVTGILSFFLSTAIARETLTRTGIAAIPSVFLLIALAFGFLVALRQGFSVLDGFLFKGMVAATVIAGSIVGSQPSIAEALATSTLSVLLAFAIARGVAAIVASAEMVRGKTAGAFAGAIAIVAAVVGCQFADAPVWSSLCTVGLGIYVAWQAIAGDEGHTSIHNFAVMTAAVLGTSFRNANLTDADFSQAHLNNTDLRKAILTRSRFYQTEQLSLARVEPNSILSQSALRHLLTTGNGRKQSYVGVDFRGANLSGADLSAANLREVDLRGAKLRGANLERANLTLANAVGTDFGGALLTGACLDRWTIDSSTNLEQVDCRYLYLQSASAKGERAERRPTQGDWTLGEFTRLFTVADRQTASVFESAALADLAINREEIFACLMILIQVAIADNRLDAQEKARLTEAIAALDLGEDITLDRLLEERISANDLLEKINSPLIKEQLYQSAYIMAKADSDVSTPETELLQTIQAKFELADTTIEKLTGIVDAAQNLSISEQMEAIADPDKRELAVNTNVRLFAIMHAVGGAMPTPGFATVSHLMIYKDQVELIQKIGKIWGYPSNYASPDFNKVVFGSVGATAARIALSNIVLLIPVAGSIISGSTAFSMTWAIGNLANQYFAEGCEIDGVTLTELFSDARAEGKRTFQDLQEAISEKQKELAPAIAALQEKFQLGKISEHEYIREIKAIA
ncbi:pentapeptide repeat-containing protein [Tumidithrix helvetica PCC 7403]|uniref:pentapeptide repeat-containing protein n=1 Tax=Tumidithrix helvetica TaxID=3457545 RepID=UPI003CC4A250